jgi:hypothetical protein
LRTIVLKQRLVSLCEHKTNNKKGVLTNLGSEGDPKGEFLAKRNWKTPTIEFKQVQIRIHKSARQYLGFLVTAIGGTISRETRDLGQQWAKSSTDS